MPEHGKLERAGWLRTRLIYELALGERSQNELAVEFGVSQPSISRFATRTASEIVLQRSRIEQEYFGVWIADKKNRIVECQADVEAINEALVGTTDEKLLAVKLKIMRQVAEELGQLKEQVELTGRMTYAVEGVDMNTLQ